MFLTATIITHNESANIERCLNSLIGVVDEIIVVDSMSTDGTPEICRRYGARVTSRPFGGFGSQRQYAVSLAGSAYVLSIDADEVLSEELRHTIIAAKKAGFEHRMYAFRVVNYICGRPVQHSGMEPAWQIRLFDKRYATWDVLDVGERLSHPAGVLPAHVDGDLYHFRCNTAAELDVKELRNARIRGRVLAAAGVSAPAPLQWFRAACSFVGCHLRSGAFLDGDAGRAIARARYKATLEAYRTARSIHKKDDK